MPKILVADDNSNIQKMVGLALKDQGIDVVAVGNGEAAVRKIADVKPDLVLADVFMPVRNGYEVCQYVKGDSALAHIPVILLVGAFDPLDEQEAQRVGADGVLKKPFVPPDPLISMVKSALARSGVPVGGAAHAIPKEEPVHVANMLAPKAAPPSVISMPALEELPPVDNEPVLEGIPTRPAPVQIEAGSQPLAFQNLLESATTEEADDPSFATTAQPQLEHDWKSGAEEEEVEEEEEESASSSWRRDGGDEALDAQDDESAPEKDWRDTAFNEAAGRKSKLGAWTPQKEISKIEEAAEAEENVPAVVSATPVAESKATPAPVSGFSQDAWAAALEPKSAAPAPAAATEPPAWLTQKPAAPAPPVEPPAVVPQKPAAIPPKQEVPAEVRPEIAAKAPVNGASMPSMPAVEPKAEPQPAGNSANSWYSAVSSPWEADAQKGSQLASAWDAAEESKPAVVVEPEPAQASSYYDGAAAAAHEDPAATVDTLPDVFSDAVKTKVEEAALPAATVEAIREETHQVTDTVIGMAPLAPASPGPAKPAAPQFNMEDLVAKVLAQMSPDVLQAVTREILKPVVEAMVREELNTKK